MLGLRTWYAARTHGPCSGWSRSGGPKASRTRPPAGLQPGTARASGPAGRLWRDGGGGYVSKAAGVYGGFTVARGTVVENATGGDGDDTLWGNAADNVLCDDSDACTNDSCDPEKGCQNIDNGTCGN